MKRIALVVLVGIIGLLSFSSCSKKNTYINKKTNLIVGDCFNDNLLLEIELKMASIGWLRDTKQVKDKGEIHNYFEKRPHYLDSSHSINSFGGIVLIPINNNWEISILNNKLIAKNTWGEGFDVYSFQTKSLSTDKHDTSFWNIVNMLKEYCEVYDSSYISKIIINESPQEFYPIR